MARTKLFPLLLAALWLPAAAAQALYGTVELLDGRTMTGTIRPRLEQDTLELFLPKSGSTQVVALVDIQKIEFSWHYNPAERLPFALQKAGDLKVYLRNGEVLEGSRFGGTGGVRELIVVLDNMQEVPVALNDNCKRREECVQRIVFQSVHVPDQPGLVTTGLTSERPAKAQYRLGVDEAPLLSRPHGKKVATVRRGVGFTAGQEREGWILVKTVGDIEVEGWIPRDQLDAEWLRYQGKE